MGLTLDALRPRSDAGRGRRSGGERRRSSARGDSLGESTPGELLWGKRPTYDFIAGQRMGERRSLSRACPVLDTGVNDVSGEAARREAAGPRCDRRPTHGRKTQLGPGCVASELGEAARREAASPRCDPGRRMTEDAARPRACPVLDTGVNGVQGEGLRDVKRPACLRRQTGACRSCGLDCVSAMPQA